MKEPKYIFLILFYYLYSAFKIQKFEFIVDAKKKRQKQEAILIPFVKNNQRHDVIHVFTFKNVLRIYFFRKYFFSCDYKNYVGGDLFWLDCMRFVQWSTFAHFIENKHQ